METLRYLRAEDLPTGDQPVPLGGPDVTPILGTWCNTDEATAGVVRMVLTRDRQRLLVRALGAGTPEPYDWGEVPATAGAQRGSVVVAITSITPGKPPVRASARRWRTAPLPSVSTRSSNSRTSSQSPSSSSTGRR